jgi:hypothetical protein
MHRFVALVIVATAALATPSFAQESAPPQECGDSVLPFEDVPIRPGTRQLYWGDRHNGH